MQQSWQKLPEKFLQRLKEIIPKENLDTILESFCKRHPSTFRANTLKISANNLMEKLKNFTINVEGIPWYTNGFILKNVPQKVLTATNLYKEGFFYVQSLSSMIPPLVLDPKPDEKILDATAAPGSKTTQMAMMMQNSGEIIANDKSRIRLYKLEANIKQQGVTNTKITNLPGQILWKRFPEYFDKTLVDVPCSMEGRFFVEDEKTYRDWSMTKIESLEQIQKFILRSAISATKVGGIIVYSTCTLAPEENEAVIDWIIKKEHGAIAIEPIHIPLLQTNEPILKWKNKIFDTQIKNTVRIFPSDTMEGFYVAKLRKLHTTVSHFD